MMAVHDEHDRYLIQIMHGTVYGMLLELLEQQVMGAIST